MLPTRSQTAFKHPISLALDVQLGFLICSQVEVRSQPRNSSRCGKLEDGLEITAFHLLSENSEFQDLKEGDQLMNETSPHHILVIGQPMTSPPGKVVSMGYSHRFNL